MSSFFPSVYIHYDAVPIFRIWGNTFRMHQGTSIGSKSEGQTLTLTVKLKEQNEPVSICMEQWQYDSILYRKLFCNV